MFQNFDFEFTLLCLNTIGLCIRLVSVWIVVLWTMELTWEREIKKKWLPLKLESLGHVQGRGPFPLICPSRYVRTQKHPPNGSPKPGPNVWTDWTSPNPTHMWGGNGVASTCLVVRHAGLTFRPIPNPTRTSCGPHSPSPLQPLLSSLLHPNPSSIDQQIKKQHVVLII